MTGTTANYLIPYPTSTDTPCSLQETLSSAADAICAMLDAVDAAVDIVVNRRMLKVSNLNSQSVAVSGSNRVQFDQVEFDTTGQVDLDVSKTSISIPDGFSGIWISGMEIYVTSISGGALFWTRTLDGRQSFHDLAGSVTQSRSTGATMDIDSPSLPDYLSIYSSTSATTITCTKTVLWRVFLSI